MNFKYYFLKEHNRLDLKVSIITGISLILGLFLHKNDNNFWYYLVMTILIIINTYIVLLLIKLILKYQILEIIHDLFYQKETHDQSIKYKKLNIQKKEILNKISQ